MKWHDILRLIRLAVDAEITALMDRHLDLGADAICEDLRRSLEYVLVASWRRAGRTTARAMLRIVLRAREEGAV